MNKPMVDSVIRTAMSNLRVSPKKNDTLIPANFHDGLFEDMELIHGLYDFGAIWEVVMDAFEEKEWIVKIYGSYPIVTDRWGKV